MASTTAALAIFTLLLQKCSHRNGADTQGAARPGRGTCELTEDTPAGPACSLLFWRWTSGSDTRLPPPPSMARISATWQAPSPPEGASFSCVRWLRRTQKRGGQSRAPGHPLSLESRGEGKTQRSARWVPTRPRSAPGRLALGASATGAAEGGARGGRGSPNPLPSTPNVSRSGRSSRLLGPERTVSCSGPGAVLASGAEAARPRARGAGRGDSGRLRASRAAGAGRAGRARPHSPLCAPYPQWWDMVARRVGSAGVGAGPAAAARGGTVCPRSPRHRLL